MSSWSAHDLLVVSCARGLAPYAARELTALGYELVSAADTMVAVRGTLHDAMRLNLCLRCAHRVLWPLAAARARRLDDLYAAAAEVPWEEWLAPDGYFTVNTAVWNDTIRDTRLPSLRAKDAIVDRLRRVCGRRPDAGREFHGAAVFVYWQQEDLRIYLDTTGEPLSRRGYRKLPGKAPMQETLAAACLLATNWDGASPLVVPMCGSGTPAIEAALIAGRRAPGILREHFAFMALQDFPQADWQALRAAARQNEVSGGLPPIIATDIAPPAVAEARQNAAAAGVAALINFEVCDFAATALPAPPGVIFANPEYGARLGDAASLEPLYARLGGFLKKSAVGYRAYILTGNADLARCIGLRAARRIAFFNGPIECRLLEFELY